MGSSANKEVLQSLFRIEAAKPSWTNDPMDRVENTSGIFFSIWTGNRFNDEKSSELQHPCLEIKRPEGGTRSESRFRLRFSEMPLRLCHDRWPNVSVECGPLTLMEGWIETELCPF